MNNVRLALIGACVVSTAVIGGFHTDVVSLCDFVFFATVDV